MKIFECPKCEKEGTQRLAVRYGKWHLDIIHKDYTCKLGRVKSTQEVMKDWGFVS